MTFLLQNLEEKQFNVDIFWDMVSWFCLFVLLVVVFKNVLNRDNQYSVDVLFTDLISLALSVAWIFDIWIRADLELSFYLMTPVHT